MENLLSSNSVHLAKKSFMDESAELGYKINKDDIEKIIRQQDLLTENTFDKVTHNVQTFPRDSGIHIRGGSRSRLNLQKFQRVSQDETINSSILEGRFDQRSRPRTAIQCKVETGKQKPPKELQEMRQLGVSNDCPSDFNVYLQSEKDTQIKSIKQLQKPQRNLKSLLSRKKKSVETAYQRRKSLENNFQAAINRKRMEAYADKAPLINQTLKNSVKNVRLHQPVQVVKKQAKKKEETQNDIAVIKIIHSPRQQNKYNQNSLKTLFSSEKYEHDMSHLSEGFYLTGKRQDILMQNTIYDRVNNKKINILQKPDNFNDISAYSDYFSKLQKYQQILSNHPDPKIQSGWTLDQFNQGVQQKVAQIHMPIEEKQEHIFIEQYQQEEPKMVQEIVKSPISSLRKNNSKRKSRESHPKIAPLKNTDGLNLQNIEVSYALNSPGVQTVENSQENQSPHMVQTNSRQEEYSNCFVNTSLERLSQKSRRSIRSAQKSFRSNDKKINSDLTSVNDMPAKFVKEQEMPEDAYQNQMHQMLSLEMNKAFIENELKLIKDIQEKEKEIMKEQPLTQPPAMKARSKSPVNNSASKMPITKNYEETSNGDIVHQMSDFELISNLHPVNPVIYLRDQTLNLGYKVIGGNQPPMQTRPYSAFQAMKQRKSNQSSSLNMASTKGTSIHDMISRMSKEFGDGSQKFQKQVRIISGQQTKADRYKVNQHIGITEHEYCDIKPAFGESSRDSNIVIKELIQNQSQTILKKRDLMLSQNKQPPKLVQSAQNMKKIFSVANFTQNSRPSTAMTFDNIKKRRDSKQIVSTKKMEKMENLINQRQKISDLIELDKSIRNIPNNQSRLGGTKKKLISAQQQTEILLKLDNIRSKINQLI